MQNKISDLNFRFQKKIAWKAQYSIKYRIKAVVMLIM